MEIICFHNPDEENGYLSNWYESKFIVDHVKFSSMEQFMMYQKAITFQDQTIAKEILQIKDSAKIKLMGRQVRNYNDHIWNGIRQIVVYEGLIAKFSQNEELKKQLIILSIVLVLVKTIKRNKNSNFSGMCGKGSNMGNRIIYERSETI